MAQQSLRVVCTDKLLLFYKVLGNLQGTGLSEQQAKLCDGFVYIQQYGAGTASLNVSVAAAIVLHHFALWAGYPDRSRQGEKFDVGERPVRRVARGENTPALTGVVGKILPNSAMAGGLLLWPTYA